MTSFQVETPSAAQIKADSASAAAVTAHLAAATHGTSGAGGTVANLTTVPVPVWAYKDGVGATLLRSGLTEHNVVNRYGADPNQVLDSSSAFLDMAFEMSALPSNKGALAIVPPGNYRIDTATRVLFDGDGLSMAGSGISGSYLRFNHADGGLSFGVTAYSRSGGFVRDISILGQGIAKNPLYLGWVNGKHYSNLRIGDAGFVPTDTQAVRDRSAGVILEMGQNCFFSNFQIKQTKGHGLILDRGTGGHLFTVLQVNEVNLTDRPDLYHVWSRQGLTTDPYGGTPQNIRVLQGFLEGVLQEQDKVVWLAAANSVEIALQTSCSSRYPKEIIFIDIASGCSDTKISNSLMRGNNAGLVNGVSTRPTKIATGIRVAAGALHTTIVSPEFANCRAGIYLEDGASATLTGHPIYTAADMLVDGPGARELVKDYKFKKNSIDALNTSHPPSVQNLGVFALVGPPTGTGADTLYCSLRNSNIYTWTQVSGGGDTSTKLGITEEVETVPTSGATRLLGGVPFTGGDVGVSNTAAVITLPTAIKGRGYGLKLTSNAAGRGYTLAPAVGETLKWLTTTGAAPAHGMATALKQDHYSFFCYSDGTWTCYVTAIGV